MEATKMYLRQMEENRPVELFNVSEKKLTIQGVELFPYESIIMSISKANGFKSMLGKQVWIPPQK